MNSSLALDWHIGQKIHSAREARNLNVEEFANTLDIPVSELFRLECGDRRLNPTLLFKALKTLSLDTKDLFADLPLQGHCGSVRLSSVKKSADSDISAT